MVWRKTAVTPLLTHWNHCSFMLNHRHDVWAPCGLIFKVVNCRGQLKAHMSGQSNHSNHSVPRATIQVKHYFNHLYRETALLTQKLILWGILWDCVQPTRRRAARAWAPRFTVTTEKVLAKCRSLKMADASLSKCSIFVYSGGIAWTRHQLSVHRVKKVRRNVLEYRQSRRKLR